MNLEGKNILVTGADGFIGSHLVEYLVSQNAHVTAFCLYNSFNTAGWLDQLALDIKQKITITFGDIRDVEIVKKSMDNMEYVFHLAALISVPYSYLSSRSFVETNTLGTLNVLEAAKEIPLTKIVCVSTSEVYGTPREIPITENHLKTGQSPYAASKIGADVMAQAYAKSFDLPIVIARPFNTYGPRQSLRAIIPTIISQLLQNEKQLQLGDIRPKRDFVFVKDTVQGLALCLNSNIPSGEELNICSGNAISIADLAHQIGKVCRKLVEIHVDQERIRPQNSEIFHLEGSNDKLHHYTQWRPSTSLEQGIEQTVAWIKSNWDTIPYRNNTYHV